MDYPKFIVSNQKVESISIQRFKIDSASKKAFIYYLFILGQHI